MSKDVPATFEHFQSYFEGGISVCCDKVKCLYGTFLGILNLIFVINHVLKNIIFIWLCELGMRNCP